jgi:uncharacterized protein (TIRG00374 family)
MRRVLTVLVVLLAVYFAVTRLGEVQEVAETVQRGNPWWLGLGLALQAAWLANTALTLRAVYRLMGVPSRLRDMLPLVITSNFVNIVAPSGGMGGMAVYISDARRRGLSASRVTIAGVLHLLLEYFSFLCVLALGLVVLVRRNNLTAIEVAASIVLLAAALTLAGLLALGAWSPARLERVLIWAARTINRVAQPILRRPYLSEAQAHEFTVEAVEGLGVLRAHWLEYVPAVLLALVGKALLIGILSMVFLAYGTPFSSGTLVAGFSIGHLFTIVSPTPSGLGVVEGALTLGLVSLRVPLRPATVITLGYRAFTFWLPFAYGFVALRVLHWQWDRGEVREEVEGTRGTQGK